MSRKVNPSREKKQKKRGSYMSCSMFIPFYPLLKSQDFFPRYYHCHYGVGSGEKKIEEFFFFTMEAGKMVVAKKRFFAIVSDYYL